MNDINSDFKQLIEEINTFLPGGQQIADYVGRPSQPVVEAGSVGGVETGISWFVDRVLSQAEHAVLFLIGAPGNGKSYWSSKLVRLCEVHGFSNPQADQLHRRSYLYEHSGGLNSLEVINDATASDGTPAPTTRQLASAIDKGTFLQVNINRGVFFREMVTYETEVHDRAELASRELMRWLSEISGRASMSVAREISGDGFLIQCSEVQSHESIVVAKVMVDGKRDSTVVAVRMDLHSILEPEPEVRNRDGRNGIGSFSNYRISKPSSSNWDSAEFWNRTAAGKLFRGVTQELSSVMPPELHELNPIRANLDQLSQEGYINGLLSIMRTAELGSGRHFAIRHVWAGIAISILGGPQENSDSLDDIVLHMEELAESVPEDGFERLVHLMRMANLRTHQSIFGADVDIDQLLQDSRTTHNQKPELHSDFVKVMARSDPSQDAMPGFSTREKITGIRFGQLDGSSEGWCSPVTDSFRGVLESQGEDLDDSILGAVKSLVLERMGILLFETAFDVALDKSIIEMLVIDQGSQPWLKPGARDAVLGWYSDYLCRLLGIHLGIGARAREVAEYVENWLEAEDDNLNSETASNLLELILPRFAESRMEEARLVGLFRPRTEAVIKPTSSPRLVALVPKVTFSARSYGDSIVLFLNQQRGLKTETLLSINLDVDLLSETHLSVRNNRGLSERTSAVTPMIERFRASAAISGGWAIVDGEEIARVR
jgi:hypothetical protein